MKKKKNWQTQSKVSDSICLVSVEVAKGEKKNVIEIPFNFHQ